MILIFIVSESGTHTAASYCISQPKMQQPNLAYNHNTLTTLRTSVSESLACIKSMKVLTATLKCDCGDSFTDVLRVVSV